MRRFLLALAAMLYVLNFHITPTAQQEPTRVTLFDGVSLKGWTGNPVFWSVKGGAIHGVTDETRGELLLSDGNFGDFRLMWDYRPGKGSPPRENIPHTKADPHQWHETEVLGNIKAGTLRMAVNGVEIVRYKDEAPSRLKRGPIGLQIHSGASIVEYKDIEVEIDPKEDRLITVK